MAPCTPPTILESPHIFVLAPFAKRLCYPMVHQKLLSLSLKYFHVLVGIFRFSVCCFAICSLSAHDLFEATVLPSTASLVLTLLFLSIDVLDLLLQLRVLVHHDHQRLRCQAGSPS